MFPVLRSLGFPLIVGFFQYEGGPILSGKDHCVDCICADAKVAALADSYRDERANMQELVDAVLTGRRELKGTLFFVSRTWQVILAQS